MSERMDDDEALPPALTVAVESLRADVAPTDVWRQRLLNDLSRERVERPARRWTVRPWAAIAACLMCAVVGAGAGAALVGGGGRSRAMPGPQAAQALEALHPAVSTVRFTLRAPAASRVSLVGDFNDWNPKALPMRRAANGAVWVIEVPLAAGRYAYSFVVDGALARDPQAPQAADDDFGSPNSVVLVKGS